LFGQIYCIVTHYLCGVRASHAGEAGIVSEVSLCDVRACVSARKLKSYALEIDETCYEYVSFVVNHGSVTFDLDHLET